MKFEQSDHNFGLVKLGAPTTCSFKFTNVGSAPLVLAFCRTSCGCDVAKWPQQPIAIDETAEIVYTYDSKRWGNINKTVSVQFAGIDSTYFLKVCGMIYDSTNEVASDYESLNGCGCKYQNTISAPKQKKSPVVPQIVDSTAVVKVKRGDEGVTSLTGKVFPNPLADHSVLELSEELDNLTIVIINSAGMRIMEHSQFSGRVFPIDRRDLAAGIYFVQVIQGNKVISTHRVIIAS